MFTGIVEDMGEVERINSRRLTIKACTTSSRLEKGGSIAVNGTCLTVTGFPSESTFNCDVTSETIRRTNLGELLIGDRVNLETPVVADKPMGGHFVQGHVDGVGRITEANQDGNSVEAWIKAPAQIMRYVVEKGFIAVDGISLTVTAVTDSSFAVSLIPITRELTSLGSKGPGDLVNLEADIIAKYVEKLAQGWNQR